MYLIKCEHLTGHLSAIVKSNSHPIVDLQHVRFQRAGGRTSALSLTRFCYEVEQVSQYYPGSTLGNGLDRNKDKSNQTYHLALLVGSHFS